MIFLSLFSLLLSKFTLAIQNLRVTHFFIEISTSVLILFISNFCSWLFYKISVCFQFHHWIQICNMLFFFYLGLIFFLLFFVLFWVIMLNWFFFLILPFNKKLLVVLYLFFISILIVIHFIIIFLILLYNWFFFFNFIIQYLVGWELGFAVFVDEVLLV